MGQSLLKLADLRYSKIVLIMGWSAPPAAPKCPSCSSSVFPAEAFMACDRTPYHKKCIKCKKCGKGLTAATLNEHQKQLYCLPCYDIVFNQQSCGGSTYEGIVTPDDLKRKEERKCPACDMRTFSEDSLDVSGWFYHRECLKCVECSRGPSADTPMMLGPKETDNIFEEEVLLPFCKFCFAKNYKLSALNVAESVKIL